MTLKRPAFSFSAMFSRVSQSIFPSPCNSSPRPKILVIAGPTAVGKSSTALQICHTIPAEIISADSVQLYRHLNIGSNKATLSERASVPHHMLDVANPAIDEYTAGNFFRAARVAAEDILSRGRVPVVVGGTMMYVRWFVHGRPATPRAPKEAKIRAAEMLEGVRGDWDRAVALLAERDARRAAMLSKNDWYRLGRALEVCETSGMGMTEMPLEGAAPGAQEGGDLDYDFRCVFLYARRIGLNRRIDQRCEEMIYGKGEAGKSVLGEVTELLKTGDLRVAPAAPSKAIGYRQTITYLVERALVFLGEGEGVHQEGNERQLGGTSDASVEAFREYAAVFQAATRGYAKQQMAWFRKDKRFRWVEAGKEDTVQTVRQIFEMDEREYAKFQTETEGQQEAIREDMKLQGKAMKRYISEMQWLKEESEAEFQVVEMAEKCARELAEVLALNELKRIKDVIQR